MSKVTQQPSNSLILWVLYEDTPHVLVLIVLLGTACEDEPSYEDLSPREDMQGEPVVVFESIRVVNENGHVLTSSIHGEMTPAMFQRAGRPWSYFDEEYIYNEDAWSRQIPGTKKIEYGYRLIREVNPSPTVTLPDDSPIEVAPGIEALLDQEEMKDSPETPVDLLVRLRNFPDWDIPLLPAGIGLSIEDQLTALAAREEALAARDALFEDMATPVSDLVESRGGEVLSKRRKVGWLVVRVPWASLPEILDEPTLSRVVLPDGKLQLSWPVGLGRRTDRTEANRFWDRGFTGERANPGRHTFGDITVGVIDDGLEDEACAFRDGFGCLTSTSRIQERFLCTPGPDPCLPVFNFATSDEAAHGTRAASVILGDYTQGQGCGANDPPLPNCLDESFTNRASGMAPEARMIFFDITAAGMPLPAPEAQIEDAFDDAIDRHVDIVSISGAIDNSTSQCNTDPNVLMFEAEAENAYDDGILVVAAAGNLDPQNTFCNIQSPADIIKTLAVTGFDTLNPDFPPSPCLSNYNRCNLAENAGARGGGDAIVNGIVRNDVLSLIDLVAPTNVTHYTDQTGANGLVITDESLNFGGTSAATPHVSGLAVLIKDQYLSGGQVWINGPGRLHTVMLAHGDRHFSADVTDSSIPTTQKTSGADPSYGFGRIHMRLLGVGGGLAPLQNRFATRSFTPASPGTIGFPFVDPLPPGTALVKCVMTMAEDMSDKTDISDIDLRLRLLSPNTDGDCASSGPGVVEFESRNDNSFDTKSMVAFESPTTTLAGRCVEVRLAKVFVTPSGITTNTMCYSAGRHDDA